MRLKLKQNYFRPFELKSLNFTFEMMKLRVLDDNIKSKIIEIVISSLPKLGNKEISQKL